MMSGSQAVTMWCDQNPSSCRGAHCSCAQLCDEGWGTLALPVTFRIESLMVLSALLFSIDDTNNIGTACLRAWYLIYMRDCGLSISDKLWKWQWGSFTKKSPSSEEKQHIIMGWEFHGQETENFHPCWSKQPWQQTWTSCLSPWYDASCFSNYTNNWMMVLNVY